MITILKISKYGESMQAFPLGYNAGYLHWGAGSPGLVQRSPSLPAVDGVLNLHTQLPCHSDFVIVLDMLQDPVGGG